MSELIETMRRFFAGDVLFLYINKYNSNYSISNGKSREITGKWLYMNYMNCIYAEQWGRYGSKLQWGQ